MEPHTLLSNPSFPLITLILPLLTIIITFTIIIWARKLEPRHCKCETCQTFISARWKQEFANISDWFSQIIAQSPTQTVNIHVLNNVITANPSNVEHILRTKFDNYQKGKAMSAILGDFLGKGIFIVDGEHWKFQRKLASLELGSISIRAYAHQILTHEMKTYLVPTLVSSSSGVVDLQDVFRTFSFRNICRLSFGVDPKGLDGLGLFEAFDTASALSAQRAMETSSVVWKAKRLLNIGSERRLRAAIAKVNVVAECIIKERRKNELGGKNDLLSRFMGSVNDDKYLRDIVVSFLLAGRDTVASGLAMFFYLLARNPDCEARIIEECERVLGRAAGPVQEDPSLEQLKEMHYLQGALYESLRLFPPVQIDSKWAQNDDVLPDGTGVRKGTRVSYHPYAMGRVEEIWGPDCLEFRPERWLDSDGVIKPINWYRYPVFQAGIRVCLGKEIALMAMKNVALNLVRRFEIRLSDPGWAPVFTPGLTATLKGGLPVVIRKRSYHCW